jgi:hypothetical protein
MSVRKFQNGEHVVINEHLPNHYQVSYGLTPGMEVKICSLGYRGHYNIDFISPKSNHPTRTQVPIKCLDKFKAKSKREQFQDQIEKAKEKIEATKAFIAETESKIRFMDEVGAEDFDETEFKAYHTLLLIEKSDMTTIEKAKAIAKLIASK